ncbi:heptaprenyl diphosphate synthase [Desulfofundulus thermobenzoicus]|uniref:Heptaprenyl diphosphate synthase n=1 Tax=Desulfofundulus thermobenzoicus TaxID=29376 RepID=A0A6N7IM15_9FIRM|nr:polyprenyl synthetase family protein [Desulfofundulus thermobenzoicus]MQL51020.1 heptaprenyl diphosphate synthase [Desulfofundulus thermobenzoicus]HHW42331.1 heptaprenyl diphosphate synthase [Desulfotomaculum sp.]
MLQFFQEIKDELAVVERELQNALQTPDPLLTETATHLLKAGGKRLRPAFSLLGGKCFNFNLERILPLAVALELIHMATLIHDDVVDDAQTRRGKPTIRACWGNRISTHVGDYLFARSLIIIARYDNPLIPRVLADTSVKMCEGEIQQISGSFTEDQSVRDYFYRINRKTALLIAASCQLGAVACGAPADIHLALRRYGHYLGMAFQITDDILDLVARQGQLGKPVGSDLRQGIITLPVIYALEQSPRREYLKTLILSREKDEKQIQEAINLILDCGAIEHSAAIVRKYVFKAKEALGVLPEKPAKNILGAIADFIGVRKF